MENRRKYHRLPSGNEPCIVRIDNVKLSGYIFDESISGVGIAGLDLLVMPYNKPLIVESRDITFGAHARHVGRRDDGQLDLGIIRKEELKPSELACTSSMLINCYIKYDSAFVICMPIQLESNENVLVQLWDGVQFRVPRSQLFPMSRSERFTMLDDPVCQKYTAKMYGFESIDPTADQQRVFEYEFGKLTQCPADGMMQPA